MSTPDLSTYLEVMAQERRKHVSVSGLRGWAWCVCGWRPSQVTGSFNCHVEECVLRAALDHVPPSDSPRVMLNAGEMR